MPTKDPDNWLDALLPFPRPEYAKQTESLLTDLLWRSDGSSLSAIFERLGDLKPPGSSTAVDPDRLVPRRRQLGSNRLMETFPAAEGADISSLLVSPTGVTPTHAMLESVIAPRARGDKSDACVPIHPALVAMQTLHGLVNKQSPANLALAIETMGWLGGAPARGHVAAKFLGAYQSAAAAREGTTGLVDHLSLAMARHVWETLPSRPHVQTPATPWPSWPTVTPIHAAAEPAPAIAGCKRNPFTWFWKKWSSLCDPAKKWNDVLPSRRFVDWAMCLLRTGLAFSYLWEAEFYTRLHERIAGRLLPTGAVTGMDRVRSMLSDGAVLAAFDPPTVPASQKGVWPAMSELLARGYESRKRILEFLHGDKVAPQGASIADSIDAWVQQLTVPQLQSLGAVIQTSSRTANNQKEFVRYLLLPRSSDDDVIDQADFYFLARSNSRHTWFHPGPEWLVVMTSLLCDGPGGQCTLGTLLDDLGSLGVRVDRSVLVGLLEESGLSTDSPDADNALVIRSGF